jgi:hypothetical protein
VPNIGRNGSFGISNFKENERENGQPTRLGSLTALYFVNKKPTF